MANDIETVLKAARLVPETRMPREAVQVLLGVGSTKLHALVRNGKLARPVSQGPRCSRWIARDVFRYLAEQESAAS